MRIAGAAYPAAMLLIIVATGNHWVLDIPAGAAIAAVGLAGAAVLARRDEVFHGVEGPDETRPWSLPRRGPS